MTGSGTQNDPWIVDTYAELVAQAAYDGYIRIGRDINITDEYPDGDMPALTMADCDIDGNNKTITNWYKTTSGFCIENTDSSDTLCNIHDLGIKNIYIAGSATGFCKRAEDNSQRVFFNNCNIGGVFYKPLTTDNGSTLRFKNCSLNCDLKSNKPFGEKGGFFDNCYVVLKSTFTGNFFLDLWYKTAKDSYLELTLPNITRLDAYAAGFENCVIDVTSNASFGVGGGSSAVSIINTSHAPNVNPDGTNTKGVDNTNWLNTVYLSSIGFNAG